MVCRPDHHRVSRHPVVGAFVAAVLLAVLAGCGAKANPDRVASPPDRTIATTTRGAGSSRSAPTTSTTATTTTTAVPTTTDPPVADITAVDLASVTYHVPCLTSGTGLVDITPAAGPTQTPEAAVQLDDLEPRYGDVTGDGRTDAVVRLGCLFVNGGNAYVSSVALVTSERDGAHQLGAAVDGFDPVVVGSRVAVARAVYAPEDARCCPSTTRYVPLTFQGDHWVEGGLGGQPLTTTDTVTTTGIGALQVGKPYGELAASLGQPVVVTNGIDSNECVYVTVEGGPQEVSGLGDGEHLGAVEFGAADARTMSGLGIGSREQDVYDAFPGQVTSEPHTYMVPDGHYLIYTPAEDSAHVAVFDTDGTAVTHFRVGEPEWASAIEGCL